jgi:hypothetical protein
MLQILHLRIKVPLFVFHMLSLLLLFPLFSIAQNKAISGNVTDQTGTPCQIFQLRSGIAQLEHLPMRW